MRYTCSSLTPRSGRNPPRLERKMLDDFHSRACFNRRAGFAGRHPSRDSSTSAHCRSGRHPQFQSGFALLARGMRLLRRASFLRTTQCGKPTLARTATQCTHDRSARRARANRGLATSSAFTWSELHWRQNDLKEIRYLLLSSSCQVPTCFVWVQCLRMSWAVPQGRAHSM